MYKFDFPVRSVLTGSDKTTFQYDEELFFISKVHEIFSDAGLNWKCDKFYVDIATRTVLRRMTGMTICAVPATDVTGKSLTGQLMGSPSFVYRGAVLQIRSGGVYNGDKLVGDVFLNRIGRYLFVQESLLTLTATSAGQSYVEVNKERYYLPENP